MSKTTIGLILYKSKTLADGSHPLMIRITQDRTRRYHSTGESCEAMYWDFGKNALKSRPRHPQHDELERILSRKLQAFKKRFMELKADDEAFTPDDLIEKVVRPVKRISLLTFTDQLVCELESEGNVGYSAVFRDCRRVLSQYLNNKDIHFSRINYEWLTAFEKYLRKGGMSDVSLAHYFSAIRSLFNKAIDRNHVRAEFYPFRKFKLSKFDTSTRKRALTENEMNRIIKADLTGEPESTQDARLYLLFSYYGWGINFVDMAKLTWSNIKGNRIEYIRTKTGTPIAFPITDEIRKIIEHFSPTRSIYTDAYLLPGILNRQAHQTPAQQRHRILKIQKLVNTELKQIAKLAKVESTDQLTFYCIRHTFATQLKRRMVNPAFIQQAMGHSDLKTTQIYLDSLNSDQMDEVISSAIAL